MYVFCLVDLRSFDAKFAMYFFSSKCHSRPEKGRTKRPKKACTGELVLFLGGLSGKWSLKKVGTCFEDSDRGSLRSSLVPCYRLPTSKTYTGAQCLALCLLEKAVSTQTLEEPKEGVSLLLKNTIKFRKISQALHITCNTLAAEMFLGSDFWLETRVIIKISTHS